VPIKINRQNGYTLVEVVIVIGLVSILGSMAVPSFSSAIQNSRLVSHYNALSASLTLARSESIKRASNVSVCAIESSGGDVCGGESDWSNGWLVFEDSGENQGTLDADEEVIKRVLQTRLHENLSGSARVARAIGVEQAISCYAMTEAQAMLA